MVDLPEYRECDTDTLVLNGKIEHLVKHKFDQSTIYPECYKVPLTEHHVRLESEHLPSYSWHRSKIAITCQRRDCIIEGDLILLKKDEDKRFGVDFEHKIKAIRIIDDEDNTWFPCIVASIHVHEKEGHFHIACSTKERYIEDILPKILHTFHESARVKPLKASIAAPV